MQLLVLLVSRAEQIVSKREIRERVWNREAVSDDSLTAAVYQLRKALGDDSAHPRFIETVPKRGYRLLVAAEHDRASAEGSAGSPPTIHSIAVLPLQCLSRDAEDVAIAQGFTAALITELARLRPLRVVSATSTLRYAGTTKRASEIAQELGVDALLEGAVVRAADRIRIDCRLVDPAHDTYVWVETFERKISDVLTAQLDVARAVASELCVRVSVERHADPAPKISSEAMEVYLQGRSLLGMRRTSSLLQARLYFERALILDARFAAAHAALSYTYVAMLYDRQHDTALWIERARSSARTALELDPWLGEAHAAHAIVLGFVDRKFQAAEDAFRRALELQPDLGVALRRYSLLLALMQRPAEALRMLEEAALREPLDLHAPLLRADVFLITRRFDQAADELRRVLSRDPTSWLPYMNLAFIHWTRGAHDDVHAVYHAAAIACDSAALARSIDRAYSRGGVTELYAAIADNAEGRDLQRPYRLFELIIAHTASGNHARSLELLEQAYIQDSPYLLWILTSPYVDALRGTRRFDGLLERFAARGDGGAKALIIDLRGTPSDLSDPLRLS